MLLQVTIKQIGFHRDYAFPWSSLLCFVYTWLSMNESSTKEGYAYYSFDIKYQYRFTL